MMDTEVDSPIGPDPVARRGQGKVAAIGGDAVAPGRNTDDAVYFVVAHNRAAIAASNASSKSSATNAAPHRRAASPCSHTASQAARKGSPETARRPATSPASTSPVPAVESHGDAPLATVTVPSGAAITLSAPLYRTTAPDARAAERVRRINFCDVGVRVTRENFLLGQNCR